MCFIIHSLFGFRNRNQVRLLREIFVMIEFSTFNWNCTIPSFVLWCTKLKINCSVGCWARSRNLWSKWNFLISLQLSISGSARFNERATKTGNDCGLYGNMEPRSPSTASALPLIESNREIQCCPAVFVFFFRFRVILVGHQFGLICSSRALSLSLTHNRKQNYISRSSSLSLLSLLHSTPLQPSIVFSMFGIWCTILRDSLIHENEQKRRANETNCATRSVGNRFKLNYLNLFYWNRCECTRAHCHQFSLLRRALHALINGSTSLWHRFNDAKADI